MSMKTVLVGSAATLVLGCASTPAPKPVVHPVSPQASVSFRILVRASAPTNDADPVDTYVAILSSRSFAATSKTSSLSVGRLGKGASVQGIVSAGSPDEARSRCLLVLSSLPTSLPGHDVRLKALTARAALLQEELERAEDVEYQLAQANDLVSYPLAEQLAAARKSRDSEARRKVAGLLLLELEASRLARRAARVQVALDAAEVARRDAEAPDYEVAVVDSCQ